jgi:cytochrome oxidase assembly protein ShyY1
VTTRTLWRSPGTVPMVAALVVIVVTCALGNWQLRRAHEKIDRAERLATLAKQAPVELRAA